MTELRIYYECLEQAHNYIKPIIEKMPKNWDFSIVLVKRPKSIEQLPKGIIQAIQSLTTPDILITGIKKGKEYPLVLIEFTEAVITEDHELQRTYGTLAAYLARIFYIKISGNKQSEKEFGGAYYNPYSTPKILFEKFRYEGFIIADWQTETENNCHLKRNFDLPGCPPEIPILKDTIQATVKSFLQNHTDWFFEAVGLLKQTDSYKSFHKKVDEADTSIDLLKTWKERKERNKNLNKLRYFVEEKWIGAKINRFSHAMDPDRGILTFISFIYSQSFAIYGIYALVRPRSTAILKKEMRTLDELKIKLTEALDKDAGGIPQWFSKELKEIANHAKSKDDEIDFCPTWEKYKTEIITNKVIMTIAFFLDGMYLNHNGIKLYWNRYKLLGNTSGNFLNLLRDYFGFTEYTTPVPIEMVSFEVDEDEVTYAITHRVFLPNKFRIISISYPGSQGGGAILPEPEKGKAQPREYPDIIVLPPKNTYKFDVLLNESKGMFKKREIERDIHKMSRYKTDKHLQSALKEILIVAQVVDKNDNIHRILIGVAFGCRSNTSTTWQPNEVDFIFRIVERKKWAIGIFNQTLRDLIPKISGDTNLPDVYKIKSPNVMEDRQLKIF